MTTLLFAFSAFARDHSALNGTWTLVPAKSDFAGQPVVQTGTVTIADRQGIIIVSRSFVYEGATETFFYNDITDAENNATIHSGKDLKSKTRWDRDVLKVTTTESGAVTLESYTLAADGTMTSTSCRPEHKADHPGLPTPIINWPKAIACGVARNRSPAVAITEGLYFRVSLAIWLRSAQSVEQDVQVAEHGEKEGVVKPNTVGNYTLDDRQYCAAHDGHVQDAGAIARQGAEFCYSQGEDRGEHDRVEEPHGENCPHRRMSAQQHGSSNQCCRNDRA